MKLPHKVLLISLVLAGVVFAAYLILDRDVREGKSPLLDRAAILDQAQRLAIQSDMTEQEKEVLFQRFTKSRERLNQAAEVISEEGERLAPLLYWPLLEMGGIQYEAGDRDTAVIMYTYAHELQPGAYPPLMNLAQLYFRDFKDYQRSAEYYRRASLINGTHLDTVYSEWFQLTRYQLNDMDGAERILIDGVRRYPEETNILAMLANYYRETGRTDEAVRRYRELLAKKPDSVVAKQALKELVL